MSLRAHDILSSPADFCVQISIWSQRKLNYSFLGIKLPVENLFRRAASVIIVGFMSCRRISLRQKTGT